MHMKVPPQCSDSDGSEKREQTKGKGNRNVKECGGMIYVGQMSLTCKVPE